MGLHCILYNYIIIRYSRTNSTIEFICSSTGLTQGHLASPILFPFFIDELEKILNNGNLRVVHLYHDMLGILFAMITDDNVLLSDTVLSLQEKKTLLHVCLTLA